MSSRRSPLIVVMQPTHLWDFPDRVIPWPLDWPWQRTIHVQRPVCAPAMIIVEISSQEPPQMSLVQDDHVVQAFAADAPDEPFNVGVLPQAPGGDQHVFDPHMPHPLPKRGTVNAIPIAQEIPGALSHGKASMTCWAVHSAVECSVMLKWTRRRRS